MLIKLTHKFYLGISFEQAGIAPRFDCQQMVEPNQTAISNLSFSSNQPTESNEHALYNCSVESSMSLPSTQPAEVNMISQPEMLETGIPSSHFYVKVRHAYLNWFKKLYE